MKSNKLIVVILVSLIIIGIVILTDFISFLNIQKIIVNQLKENQLIETEHAANQIEDHVLRVKDELITLSKFPIIEALDLSQCSGDMKIINEKIKGRIDSLLKVDKEGNIVECSSPRFSNYLGLNIKNKDYFKVPKETNEPFITGMVRQGSSMQIIVSAPLFETSEYTPYPNFIGEFKGVLLSIIEIGDLYNLYLHPILSSDKNYFLLVNVGTGETIIESSSLRDYPQIKSLPLEDSDSGMTIYLNDFGETIVTSSDIILSHETWRLIILTPLKNIGKEVESVQKRHLFSLGFVIVVIITTFFLLISLYKSKEDVQFRLNKANVTLEKFGIKAEIEKDKYSQADIILESRKVYLIKEEDENHAHELFISSLNRGFAGLGIVREDPRVIKKRYNLQKTSFIWLTKTKVENLPCETNIDSLFELVSEFIKNSEKSVVLIDRLDYILSENDFENVIKEVHALRDLALAHECIIILSINPELIKEPQLRAIEAETIDLYGKYLRSRVELSDLEVNILRYINDNNVTNRLASYKNITDNFKITKPTTRVKINKLQNLGLLQVEPKGRFKSLKITSAGRRMLR